MTLPSLFSGYAKMLPTDEIEGLDDGIREPVRILREHGVETFESCQGGEGHCFERPTIRFMGNRTEGFRAYHILDEHGYDVIRLRRIWTVLDGELTGPDWEVVLNPYTLEKMSA